MNLRVATLFVVTFLGNTTIAAEPTVHLWHGDSQTFGHLGGHPQRWVNVLGHAAPVTQSNLWLSR
jgi:hypothetical protein